MRTLTITLISAFVILLAQQLTATSRGFDREEHRASQGVLTGVFACSSPESIAVFDVHAGLGVLAIPTTDRTSLSVLTEHAEDCLDLIPALAEQVPHRICEVGNTFEAGNELRVNFVCTGRADAVISAVGKMARAVMPNTRVLD